MKREDWDRRYGEAELLWSAEPNQFVVAELAGLEPGVALELACGEGRNAIWLAGRGWCVSAVDFSSVAIARARELAGRRGLEVDWQIADVLEHRPAPGSFDLVLVTYLHMPWPEMEVMLGMVGPALAPGGVFLLVGHDESNLDHGHGGPRDPAVLYGPERVAAALGDLVVERAERVRRQIAGPGPASAGRLAGDRATHRHPGFPASGPRGPAGDAIFAIDNLVRARRPPSRSAGTE